MVEGEGKENKMIPGKEFDQISRVEIRKSIANAFISLENELWGLPEEKSQEIIEQKASQMKSEVNAFIDRLTDSPESALTY